MAFVTWEDTVSNGSQTDYNIIYPFLDRDHSVVKFNGAIQPTSAYSFLSDSQVRLTSPAASGVTVRVQRITPKTVQTDFNGGAILPESDLDNGYLQNLYQAQELQDLYDEAIAGAVSVITISPLHNLSATVAPSTTDDSDSGYAVGSQWYDTVLKLLWSCSDASVGAAVWTRVDVKNNVSASDPTVNNDVDENYVIGSRWWNTTDSTLFICEDASDGAASWVQLTASLSYPLTHTGLIEGAESAGIASAATIDLSGADGNRVPISGSTGPVTSLGTLTAGTVMVLEFAGTPTLTHHATQLQLPNDTNIVVEAGDIMVVKSDGANAWTCVHYQRASGQPLIEDDALTYWTHTGSVDLTSGSPTSVTLLSGLSGVEDIVIHLEGISTNSANQAPLLQLGDSGGLETSGYSGDGASINATNDNNDTNSSGFFLSDNTNFDAAQSATIRINLHHFGSNVWGIIATGLRDTSRVLIGTGIKTLSGELTQVAVTTSIGTATFDGGTAYGSSK